MEPFISTAAMGVAGVAGQYVPLHYIPLALSCAGPAVGTKGAMMPFATLLSAAFLAGKVEDSLKQAKQ